MGKKAGEGRARDGGALAWLMRVGKGGVVLEDELGVRRRHMKKASGATLRSSQAGVGRRMARLGGAGHAGRRRERNPAEAAQSGGGELLWVATKTGVGAPGS